MVFSPHTVIFGCGNTLMGDDGFGPAVIARLEERHRLPEQILAVDAGTGVREYLFDYLLAPTLGPEKIFILDAVDLPDRIPGELFFLDPGQIPACKSHDFSLHQFPTVNLLQELARETGIRVFILAAQVSSLPDRVRPGLSAPMERAVAAAAQLLADRLIPQPRAAV